jgi:hypothetical protein
VIYAKISYELILQKKFTESIIIHYIENAQENKKNTILSYNIAENSKRVKRNEEKVCVCVCMDAVWLVH